jgi:hypothetical protein
MARNQVHSGTLVAAKIVPAITDVCRRQALHWYSAHIAAVLMPSGPNRGAAPSNSPPANLQRLPTDQIQQRYKRHRQTRLYPNASFTGHPLPAGE